MKKLFLAGSALCFGIAFGEGVTATWKNFTPNTPDTAYDWAAEANWEGGVVAGRLDVANVKPTARIYVRVPQGLVLNKATFNENVMILGDRLTFLSRGSGDALRAQFAGGNFFCDIALDDAETVMPYMTGPIHLAGHLFNRTSAQMTMASSYLYWRFDRFARSSAENRANELADCGQNVGVGNTGMCFYAPIGSDAVSGTWRHTKGSPYLYRTSDEAHALVPGAVVSGEGLPDGAFVKHVFDDATIELSAPVPGEDGEGEVTFAACHPTVSGYIPNFVTQGGGCAFGLWQARAEDNFRIEFGKLSMNYAQGVTSLGYGPTDGYAGAVPGTLVIRDVSTTSKQVSFTLSNKSHLEFVGTPTRPSTSFPATVPFTFASASAEARMTVTNGIEGTIGAFDAFSGTVVKDGEGRLNIGMLRLATGGKLTVEAGSATLYRTAAAGAGELSFGTLTVGAAGQFVVPEGGLTVKSFNFEPGARLGGTGTLTVLAAPSDLTGLVVEPGARIAFRFGKSGVDGLVENPGAGAVVGHPAFWVDSQKESSITYVTEGDVNYVTRWDDCRAGETMFCTNYSVRPTFVKGTFARGNYVKLTCHGTAKSFLDIEQLVWSEPVDNIKAVFVASDVTDGGGEILGRCSWRLPNNYYGSQGGPFYRGGGGNKTSPLVSGLYGTPCVVNGTFYVNGREVVGSKTGYDDVNEVQIVESHVNSAYQAGSAHYALCCDAFGSGYVDNDPNNLMAQNGHCRIAECIVYTNELSYVERLQVAQYLSRKWRDCNIYYDRAGVPSTQEVAAVGETYDIGAGQGVGLAKVTGGAFAKSGDGVLYLDALDNAALSVEGGTVEVNSMDRDRFLPVDTWIHVDALEAGTVETDANGKLVKWTDVSGCGLSYKGAWGSANVKFDATAVGGKPGVTLGETVKGAGGGALQVYKADGTKYADSADVAKMECPLTKTALVVYNSSPGGGALLGGTSDGYPSKGLPHTHALDEQTPIVYEPTHDTSVAHGLPALHDAIKNKTAVFRVNREDVDPWETPYTLSDEMLTFRYAKGRKTHFLGAYSYSACSGGLKYGEVALYPRELTDAELAKAEAYLAKKWFGVDTPGFGPARTEALTVAAQATLNVRGLAPLAVETAGGGGTVNGDVTVSDGVTAAVAGDGTVGTLTVAGAVELPADGTVTLTGDADKIQPGAYTLLAATQVTGGAGVWTVTGGPSKYAYSVSLRDGALILSVTKKGFLLLVK